MAGTLLAGKFERAEGAVQSKLLAYVCASILPLYLSMFRVNVGTAVLRVADIAALVAIALSAASRPSEFRAFLRAPLFLLYALCCYILCQGALQANFAPSVKECLQLLFATGTVVVIGVQIQRTPRHFLHALIVLTMLSLASTLAFHFSEGIYYRYKFANDGRYVFGLASALLLLMCHESGWRSKWALLLALSLVPLAASLERKGALGVTTIALMLALTFVLKRTRISIGVPLLFIAISVAAAALGMHEELADYLRRVNAENFFVDEGAALFESNVHRQALILNGWDIFTNNWMWGTGADSIKAQMRAYFGDPRLANGTHNFYLDALVEYGVVGAGMLFSAIALGAYGSLRLASNWLPALMLAAYLLFVVTFMSEGTHVLVMALLPMVIGPLFDFRTEGPSERHRGHLLHA